ncbi:hypothetical protein PIB30_029484 [Stylosanthes scabra]|uniref:Uncharacterized protein n=1 Tax=Stylosanthes scabra TaxID=79078 RepID=A0ABU6RBL7_9FABA|nr:hypothetical protein [Stylosanthes scabra]
MVGRKEPYPNPRRRNQAKSGSRRREECKREVHRSRKGKKDKDRTRKENSKEGGDVFGEDVGGAVERDVIEDGDTSSIRGEYRWWVLCGGLLWKKEGWLHLEKQVRVVMAVKNDVLGSFQGLKMEAKQPGSDTASVTSRGRGIEMACGSSSEEE